MKTHKHLKIYTKDSQKKGTFDANVDYSFTVTPSMCKDVKLDAGKKWSKQSVKSVISQNKHTSHFGFKTQRKSHKKSTLGY